MCAVGRPSTNGGSSTRASGTSVPSKPLGVLLVEGNQDVARAAVRDFGRSRVAVTVARTLAEAKTLLRQGSARIDVVLLLSPRMPDGRSESLLPDIESSPRQPAVIITSSSPLELETSVLEYRPVVIPKPTSTASLLRVVRTVASGYIQPTIRRFVERFNLSKREAEAILLLAWGLRAKQVARGMGCAEPTVYGHLARVCEKTGCSDSHEVLARLLAFACQALGHTPPDHDVFVDDARLSDER